MAKTKTNVIGFSHNYKKLHGQTKATLLKVEAMFKNSLSQKTIDYDTVYCDDGTEDKFFDLKHSTLVMLVFLGEDNIPFTTFRRFREESLEGFNERVGQEFNITVKKKVVKKEDLGDLVEDVENTPL